MIRNATGYMVAAHKIELPSKVVGRVAWIGVEKGDPVKEGQVLVRLEDDDYQAKAQEANCGANETAATTPFALVFLFDLLKAFWHLLWREIPRHREGMIRAFAVGLAVASIRPIVGAFFATSPLHLTPQQFFGTAF